MVALGVAGEFSLFHFFFVTIQGLDGVGFEMSVGLHKFRGERIKEAKEIIEHKHLTITVRSRTNPDRGDRKGVGDFSGQLGRYSFQDKREGSGGFESLCILEQLGGLIVGLALDLVSPQRID